MTNTNVVNTDNLNLDMFYKYENIQEKLNRMNEVELQSGHAEKLIDQANKIYKEWNK